MLSKLSIILRMSDRISLSALSLLIAVAAVGVPQHAEGKATWLTLALRIKIAQCGGKPARSKAWLKKHVKSTQAVFKRHRIRLQVTYESFSPKRCELLTRAHRHQMASFVTMDRSATVLVLKRVRDIDVPSYNLMGVHWRYAGKTRRFRGRRWVFLTARAKTPVLAHELCHYFVIGHDKAGGNLMTPGPSDPAWKKKKKPKPFKPILLGWQARRLRKGIVALSKR
jgi:hypothetical protein